jgi:acyl-coenzyme A synthetase/AMP-(fatty) acid ligase
MVYGGTTLDLHEHFSPPRILERLAQSDADVFLGAPSMYHFLAEAAPSPAPSFSRVRYLLSCTAPLSEGLITRFHEIFGAVICQHYGSSETGAVANHVPSQVLVRPGSVGRAMAGVEVEIRSDDGGAVAHGEEGEVFVRSAALASGYFALVPECATPFRDGGFYTGDLGRLDPQGFLEVTGRRDDMINVAGFKVSPLEVKRVLESYAPVREAAVFGVADPAAGEVVHAMVSLKALATEAGIIAHCRMLLSDHKVPRHVDIVADLPRGATGKVKLPGKGARS